MKTITAFLCALALTPLAAFAGEGFPDISHAELLKAIEAKKVTLIDVNGSDSFKEGHIPGAIDFDAAGADLASKLPKEKDALIVAYCGGPACAAYTAAAKAAVKLGYTNVKHYSQGISGWKEAKAPVEKS